MKAALWLCCCLFSFGMMAQEALGWPDLEAGISWKKAEAGATFPGFLEAHFSEKLTNLEGKQVSLTGFLILLEGTEAVYMLSKNPMAQCFFCGNGGPETICGLTFKKKPKFEMDDLISVTGILRLNENDPTQCYYSIAEVEAFGL